jgi:ureidoacrylate peracid hydrolase
MGNFEIPGPVLERVRARRGRVTVFERLDAKKTALLVIDLQNAFVMPGMPLAMQSALEIIPNVNRLADAVRSHGGKIVWIKMTHAPTDNRWTVYFDSILSRQQAELEESALTRGTPGHELHADLDIHDTDMVMEKTRFSAFIHGSSMLDEFLRVHGLDTLLITGAVTNSCCEATARDGMMLNYKIVFVSDANAAHTQEEHNATLSNMIRIFGDVADTDTVIERLYP